uniref:Uncharacterized protein n=1 Tax=Anguilla anguilla TaxID=7936 RepID=A0A0E9SA19_ANGAN
MILPLQVMLLVPPQTQCQGPHVLCQTRNNYSKTTTLLRLLVCPSS